MARPNPRQDGAAFLESVVAHLQLAGNAYLEAVTLDGRPRELHALRPDRMRVVPGTDGWPEAYEYHLAGPSVRFDQAQALPPILQLTHFHALVEIRRPFIAPSERSIGFFGSWRRSRGS
jgi:phage portal protein BeeE